MSEHNLKGHIIHKAAVYRKGLGWLYAFGSFRTQVLIKDNGSNRKYRRSRGTSSMEGERGRKSKQRP